MELTDTKIQEILAMWDSGKMSVKEIALEVELSEGTVRKALLGAHRPTKRLSKRPDEQNIVDAYLDETQTVGAILSTYNLSYPMLYTVLARNSIPLRKSVQAPGRKMMLDAAVEMYEAGAPIWDIMRQTGISQPTLHGELHKRGILLRRPRKSAPIHREETK